MIRLAKLEDLDEILEIYAKSRIFMKATGNPNQWGENRPTNEAVITDINENRMYTIWEDDSIIGVFSIYDYTDGITRDKDYDNIIGEWLNDKPYIAIHKVASSGKRGGIFRQIVNFAKEITDDIRIDTHKDNRIMQLNIKRNGFKYCGIVYIEGKYERLAYHLSKKNN